MQVPPKVVEEMMDEMTRRSLGSSATKDSSDGELSGGHTPREQTRSLLMPPESSPLGRRQRNRASTADGLPKGISRPAWHSAWHQHAVMFK